MTDQDREDVREVPLCDLRDFYETARDTLGDELFYHLVKKARVRTVKKTWHPWPVKLETR